MTQTVVAPIADLTSAAKCETAREDCPREVEWYVMLSCCDHQGTLCNLHAQEGMDEWNSPSIVAGLFAYECAYCGADPMPRPTWRKV